MPAEVPSTTEKRLAYYEAGKQLMYLVDRVVEGQRALMQLPDVLVELASIGDDSSPSDAFMETMGDYRDRARALIEQATED